MRNVNVFFSAVTATIRGKVFFGNLFQEWEPKLRDLDWLKNSHYQSYLILNLCRILYTVLHGEAGSKKISATWAKRNFADWSEIIDAAQKWQYGQTMNREEEAIQFLSFAIQKVKETGVV